MVFKNNHILKFFLLTFIWSWGFWLVPVFFGIETAVPAIFYAIGGIAPTSAGIILAYLKRDQEYWQDFWQRIVSFRQISFKWYLIIFLLIPITSLFSLIINFFITGLIPELSTLKDFLADPVKLITFSVIMLFFGPIIEEIGWRGFALDHLEKRYSWFVSSIILGSFWALWHLPLFFIAGTYQYALMQESFVYFISFIIAFFPLSVIMDWIYNNTGRSILSGVLFHFAINFFGELIDMPNNIKYIITTIILFIIAIVILISWKKKDSYPLDGYMNV